MKGQWTRREKVKFYLSTVIINELKSLPIRNLSENFLMEEKKSKKCGIFGYSF